VDFTREPIIETVITPKEGCKLVVRSSKSTAQEEYFVDAIEVVSFGHSFFFRSLERPKAFLVPVSDYEVLEVREARMVLKNVGIDRTIKIAGGRDAQMRSGGMREPVTEKGESNQLPEESLAANETSQQSSQSDAKPAIEARLDKKRDRRRQYRRRRGREDGVEGGQTEELSESENKESTSRVELTEPRKFVSGEESPVQPITTTSILTSLLPPPSTLISETIARYKENALFRDAFFSKEESKPASEEKLSPIPIQQPEYGSFEASEEEEERIYQQRKQRIEKNIDDAQPQAEAVIEDMPEVVDTQKVNYAESPQEPLEGVHLPVEPTQPSPKEDEIKNENHQK
jgi:hypothetical protein